MPTATGHTAAISARKVIDTDVFDTTGKILGEILAGGVANFCFGGKGNNMLFMMCDTAINIATLAATGV